MLYHPKNLSTSTRSKSISNIFSKTNTSSLSPKNLDFKRMCLIVKFSEAIKLKYHTLFKEKGYTNKMLSSDITQLVSFNNLDEFDYNNYMLYLEKDILKKVTAMPTLSPINTINITTSQNPLKPNDILLTTQPNSIKNNLKFNEFIKQSKQSQPSNDIINTNNIILKRNASVDLNLKTGTSGLSGLMLDTQDNFDANSITAILSQKNMKVKALRLKEMDEWGLKTKQNYNSFLNEQSNKRSAVLDKQKILNDILDKQTKEKQKRLLSENSDQFYLNDQLERIKKQEENELLKKFIIKEKFIENEKFRKTFIKDRNSHEKEQLLREKKLDLELINNYKLEIQLEKDRLLQKKELERLNMIKANELLKIKHALDNEERLKDKIEQQKREREMKEKLEKQDRDREQFFINVKDKSDKREQFYKTSVFSNDNLNKKLEDMRYLKELEEIENR